MLRALAAVVLAALPAAVLADPPVVLSPGQFLPGDAAISAAAGVQRNPVICKGGDQFLAVWEDNASTISELAWQQTESDLVGMRLDAAGQPIDATPFTISRALGYQRNPRVVWSGSGWVVAWENQSPTAGYYESRLNAQRISPSGELVGDPFEPFPTNGGDDVHMASNGSDVVFVTQSYSAGEGGLLARRMSADGVFYGGPVVLVPETYYLYFFVEIHSAGGEYLITYNADTGPVVQRLSSTLDLIGGPVSIPGRRFIASNGSQYLLVFDGGQFGNTLLASPMQVDGTLVVPGGVPLHDMSTGAIWSLDAAYSDGVWWLVYDEAWNGLSFQRITDNGALLDPSLFVYPGVDRDWVEVPKVAGLNAGGVVTLWQDYRSITGVWPAEIYSGVVQSPSSFSATAPLSNSTPAQMSPEISVGPGHYLLVYASKTSSGTRIMAQRLTPGGGAIDAEPVEVGVAATNGGNPAAAWNGSCYLVTWTNGTHVLARRMSASLEPLDPTPLTVMPGAAPDVAALGGNFLVVTTAYAPNPQFRNTWARRIGGDGQLMDGAGILLGGGYANFAQVETFDGRWLACWQSNWTHDSPNSDVHARFVDADGTAEPSLGVSSTSGNTGHPRLAIGPDYALMVWHSSTLSNANNDVQCRRIRPDGTSPDPANVMVSNAVYRQLFPAAAWTGDEYFMAWDDRRDAEYFFDQRDNVYASRISNGGAVVDPAGVMVFGDDMPEITPTVASMGNGRFLVAASVFRPEEGMQSYRVEVRVGGPPCPADVDGDGVVGFGDLNMILSNYGLDATGGGVMEGDINGDGFVNFADLNEALSAYGQSC